MGRRAFSLLSVAGVLGSAAMAFGQPGGSISQSNMFFSIGAAPSSGTIGGAAVPEANLRANGPIGIDHAYQSWWWYRMEGDTREYALNDSGGGATQNISPPNRLIMTQNYASFRSNVDWEVVSTGSATGFLRSTLTITNTSSSRITINLFNYLDIDLNNTASDDSAFQTAPNQVRIVDSTGPYIASYEASGAGFRQFGSFPDVRDALTNNSVDDLVGGLPFGPGNFTGAFQWSITVDPGFSRSVIATVSLVPGPGALGLMAAGGLLIARRRR